MCCANIARVQIVSQELHCRLLTRTTCSHVAHMAPPHPPRGQCLIIRMHTASSVAKSLYLYLYIITANTLKKVASQIGEQVARAFGGVVGNHGS